MTHSQTPHVGVVPKVLALLLNMMGSPWNSGQSATSIADPCATATKKHNSADYRKAHASPLSLPITTYLKWFWDWAMAQSNPLVKIHICSLLHRCLQLCLVGHA
jgi:hypothetical protein